MVKFFWSKSIQNVPKLILNQKSHNRNRFPCTSFPGTVSFFGHNDQNSKKMTKSKRFGRNFFGSESIQNVSNRV